MTIQEFLNLTPDQQALEAAKGFTEKPWKHNWCIGQCSRCPARSFTPEAEIPCPVPDPLTLDRNTAGKIKSQFTHDEWTGAAMKTGKIVIGDGWEDFLLETKYNYIIHIMTAAESIAASMECKNYFKE